MINTFPSNIIGYYTMIKLISHTNSFDSNLIKNIICSLLNFQSNIKQKKLANELVMMINNLLIKYNCV